MAVTQVLLILTDVAMRGFHLHIYGERCGLIKISAKEDMW
jgi:hypothetical protein